MISAAQERAHIIRAVGTTLETAIGTLPPGGWTHLRDQALTAMSATIDVIRILELAEQVAFDRDTESERQQLEKQIIDETLRAAWGIEPPPADGKAQ